MKYFETKNLKDKKEEVTSELNKKLWVHRSEEFTQYLNKYLKNDSQIVDLGCGSGYLAERLSLEFKCNNIELVDLDDYRTYEVAKAFTFNRADFNVDKLPFENNSKDIIFAIEVFEHLENGFHFIREIERVLNSQGILIISIPNAYSIFSRVKFLLNLSLEGYSINENHINFLPKDIFLGTLFQNFKLVDSFFNQRFLRLNSLGLSKWINLKYPKNEFFSNKAGYIFKRI